MTATDATQRLEPDSPDPAGPAVPSGAWALSPSRAGDFMTCPLLYRFRVIDRLPEPPSAVAVRGTLVHAVLERLFYPPADRRDLPTAVDLLLPEWERLRAERPELATLFDAEGEPDPAAGHQLSLDDWLTSAETLLGTYFRLEDPRRVEPAEREMLVEIEIDGAIRLRGYVDRLDVAPTGALRIVDYKTGNAPSELFEEKALFQLKFYALVIWRLRGVVPSLLQLMYLGDGQVLRYAPDEADLLATERKVRALWTAIERALAVKDFPPRPGRVCDWCAHQALCPAFGGTPPEYPDGGDTLPIDEPAWSDDIAP
jgi:putative RecB family exonuclease